MAAKVFVASSPSETATALRNTLELIGLSTVDPAHGLAQDDTLSKSVRAAIESADMVVVWLERPLTESQAYELGLAAGLEKPIAVLSDKRDPHPASLGYRTVSVDPADTAEVANALEAAFSSTFVSPGETERWSSVSTPSKSQAIGELADTTLSRWQSSPASRRREVEAVAAIQEGLKAGGATTLQRSSVSGRSKGAHQVDLAVWLDDFEGNLGNPLVIEVKRQLTAMTVPITLRQIQQYLELTGAAVGLIVYIEGDLGDSFDVFRYAGRRVTWMPFTQLFAEWRTTPFPQIVRRRVLRTS